MRRSGARHNTRRPARRASGVASAPRAPCSRRSRMPMSPAGASSTAGMTLATTVLVAQPSSCSRSSRSLTVGSPVTLTSTQNGGRSEHSGPCTVRRMTSDPRRLAVVVCRNPHTVPLGTSRAPTRMSCGREERLALLADLVDVKPQRRRHLVQGFGELDVHLSPEPPAVLLFAEPQPHALPHRRPVRDTRRRRCGCRRGRRHGSPRVATMGTTSGRNPGQTPGPEAPNGRAPAPPHRGAPRLRETCARATREAPRSR